MIITEKKCCGCSACVNICPQKSIELVEDNEGFFYPKINDKTCTKCEICKQICPLNSKRADNNFRYKYFGGYNLLLEARKNSSSGGVFILLAEFILNQGGRVFGASFDDNYNVVHTYIDEITDIEKLLGSKYVQSDMGNCFEVVKNSIKEGKCVLFSGTPCQIAGLKNYLGKYSENENLYLLSVFCHGVPSPKVWKRYIRQFKSDIQSVYFRDKEFGWNDFCFCIKLKTGKNLREKFFENVYMKGFLNNLFLRPSCYECEFKERLDVSDISLGDFWGVEKTKPQLYDNKGCSVLVIKSKKGEYLFEKIIKNLYVKEIKYFDFATSNPSYQESVCYNFKRKKFFKMLNNQKNSLNFCIEKCIRDPLVIRIKRFVYKLIKRVK